MSMVNRILKIISSAIFVLLLIVIVLIIFYIVRVNFLASDDKLGEVKINFYTILTQSMHPTIDAGDVVVTYKNDKNAYNTGDIITFISNNNGGIVITHRIYEVYNVNNALSYKTKGDNNNAPDNEIVSSDKVLGKVVFRVPKAGYIQQFLISKTGWVVAVVLPALGIIIYDVMKLVRSIARKGLKNNEQTEKARKRLKEVMKNGSEE